MNDFAELERQDLRLCILRFLNEDADYTINESLLHTLVGTMGHHPSRDQLRTQIRWLQEQGLVTVEEPAGVLIPTLTERGRDVALGRGRVDGVKRPGPPKG